MNYNNIRFIKLNDVDVKNDNLGRCKYVLHLNSSFGEEFE